MDNNQLQKKYDLVKSSLNKLEHSKKGELYLFIVGVNSYQKERNLNYCRNEANDFVDIFYRHNDIKRKNIYSLFDSNATKNNILSYLEEFQKILSTNDRLVIYFAGHGHDTEYANFFVPYDGSKDNYTSCIPNHLIANSITELRSDFVLLFYDLKLANIEFKNYHIKTSVNYLKTLRNELAHSKKENTLYKEFIDFFSRRSYNRVKESFCFLKDEYFKTKDTSSYWGWSYENKLNDLLKEKYSDLLSLIKESKTEQVLQILTTILENNDSDLYQRVETLRYKLNEVNAANRNTAKEIIEDKKAIKQITCEVIERINQNGFYLVKTPKDKSVRGTKKKPKIKILFTSANPRDENFLRLNQEAMLIEYELMKAKYRDNFEFIKIKALDINELQNALLNQSPQFLHFSGHGNCDGIALLNEIDKAKLVKTKPLAELFKLFSTDIQCIFLNSCHSIGQSEEISKYIKKVVCMSNEVPDDVAIHFATAFYKSIGAGKDIDFSFDFAKNSIDLNGIKGSDIPLLLPNN